MSDLHTPIRNPAYRIEIVEPGTVFLLNEQEQIALEGVLYRDLFLLLDGKRTKADLIRELTPLYSRLEIAVTLKKLEELGYVWDVSKQSQLSHPGYWASCGLSLETLESQQPQMRVQLVSVGNADIRPLARALQGFGVAVCEPTDPPALPVVVAQDYLDSALASINEVQFKKREPWIIVKPFGQEIWLGPVFVPKETGCWQCLAQRLKDNRPVQTFIQAAASKVIDSPSPSLDRPLAELAANLAAVYVANWLHHLPDARPGLVTSLSLPKFRTVQHVLTRASQCETCGSGKRTEPPRVVEIISRRKLPSADGGHRTVTAEETVARLSHHVSPITGIVSKLEAYETNSPWLHVHRANHRLFSASTTLSSLRESLENTTAGKGRTATQSQASALCESLERYSGIFTGTEARVLGSYAELKDQAIHPSAYLHFSATQYRQRHEWNAAHSSFSWIPEPFDESRPIEWTPVWSLTNRVFKYFPTAYCYYDYRYEPGHVFCVADSNGCASGNNLEEAVLQGFLELVERDSVALWWYNRLSRPGVDLDSFDDPYFKSIRKEYQDRNREFWALDLTSDLGIPTFAVVSRRLDAREEIIQGYGAHFDPHIALSRAVTEMNQMLAHLMFSRQAPMQDPDLDYWYESATIADEGYLKPAPALPPSRKALYPFSWQPDFREDIRQCVATVAAKGLEMFVLDQSRAEVGTAAVRVIVPGLRHFWARLAPGRLYDVPVQMGWLKTPMAEEQMNPLPICS